CRGATFAAGRGAPAPPPPAAGARHDRARGLRGPRPPARDPAAPCRRVRDRPPPAPGLCARLPPRPAPPPPCGPPRPLGGGGGGAAPIRACNGGGTGRGGAPWGRILLVLVLWPEEIGGPLLTALRRARWGLMVFSWSRGVAWGRGGRMPVPPLFTTDVRST